MSILDLGVLYLIGGVASAVFVWKRRRSLSSALLALVLWPLWLPFALGDRPSSTPSSHEGAARIEGALADARAAAEGTPFEGMLRDEAMTRIAREVQRACERLAGLDTVLAQPAFQRAAALSKLAKLEDEGAPEGIVRTARLHLESVERLSGMRAQQAAALSELEQVLIALRSQLEVARYAGSMNEGFDAIVSDLWARVEGLGEAFEGFDAPASGQREVG